MNLRDTMRASLAIVALLASAHRAFAASPCASTREAKVRLRTVAWVNTTCRTEAGTLFGHQELYVQRGDRSPVVVSEGGIGPVPDPGGLCRQFGGGRRGTTAVLAGAYMAVAVSPDGARVAFEVNDKFSVFGPRLSEDEKGLYLVRVDGSDLVKLGPPTDVSASFETPWGSTVIQAKPLAFSRDGRYVVYVDLGQADDGSVDSQLWSIRLADRKRTQLTHLGKRHGPSDTLLDYKFSFTNDTTIGFYTYEYATGPGHVRYQEFYSVSVNGERFRKLSPVKGPNGQVIDQFAVAGGRPAAAGLILEGTPQNPRFSAQQPRELFVAIGKNVLQLTHFNRSDVAFFPPVVSPTGSRIFFTASANPFGCNPTNNCQVFSIDSFGGQLRQLTRLQNGEQSEVGCFLNAGLAGCLVDLQAHEGTTRTVVFDSSCDPLGTNPAGNQLFAMRPDGSGLRQITQARGVVTDTPDVVEVELPGPFAYQ